MNISLHVNPILKIFKIDNQEYILKKNKFILIVLSKNFQVIEISDYSLLYKFLHRCKLVLKEQYIVSYFNLNYLNSTVKKYFDIYGIASADIDIVYIGRKIIKKFQYIDKFYDPNYLDSENDNFYTKNIDLPPEINIIKNNIIPEKITINRLYVKTKNVISDLQ